jgi:ankyrin repeat protein
MAKETQPKKKEVPLISAAQKGDVKQVHALLKPGAEVDATDAESPEIDPGLNFLYSEAGLVYVEKSDLKLGRTALMWAARNGHADIVRLLVNSGSNVNAKDKVGLTPLMLAVINGHVEVVRILLGAKANVQAKERNGSTALIFAVESQNPQIVHELLAAGADANSKSKQGQTPLMIAARKGDPELIQELLKAGADPKVQAQGRYKPTALGNALSKPSREYTGEQLLDLGGGASQGEATYADWLAAEAKELEKRLKVVRLLLQAGADVNSQEDDSGSTPLMETLRHGYMELVPVLLDAGADINAKKNNGVTPLMYAAQGGSPEAVRLLLGAGADIDRQDSNGWTALSNAAIRGNLQVVDALLEAGPEIQGEGGRIAMTIAAEHGNCKMVQELLARGADVNAPDKQGRTILDAVINQLEIAGVRKDLDEQNLQSVLELLKRAGARSGAETARPSQEESMKPQPKPLPDFGPEARKQEFRKALEKLKKLCGSEPQPLGEIKGGFSFAVPQEKAEQLLSNHQADFLEQGYYLFRCVSNHGIGGQPDSLALLPTTDKYRVIEAMQTNGANCDLMTDDIIHWLKELEKDQPFELTGIGFDYLEGQFTSRLKNSRQLAKKMYAFCPDIVDQGTGSVAELARELKKSNRLYFWWD